MSTLASLLHPAYEPFAPGEELAEGAQLVDGQWWHPQFGCDSLQFVVDNARQALAPKIDMNQAAWLNVAICAAQRAKIAVQEVKSLKPEDPRRRLLINREIDEFDTVNMAFNRAAGTRVLLDSVTFRWMFDYSELDQSVIEEAP
jgi:hypothetical protein